MEIPTLWKYFWPLNVVFTGYEETSIIPGTTKLKGCLVDCYESGLSALSV